MPSYLVGIGALAIPGIGPIMLAGAAATTLATTVAGTAIGAAAGTLLGGLIGLGIPEERARAYDARVSAGEYLVIVDGTNAEIARAEVILNHRGVEEWGVYDIPASPAGVPVAATNAIANQPANPAVEAVKKYEERQIVDPAHKPDYFAPVQSQTVVPSASAAEAEEIKLYEERLVADKARAKMGEVAIGKRVEVETAHVSVPIEKERVIIERNPIGDMSPAPVGADAFRDQEIRVEIYEEAPDIHKETFVREEVNIRKEVTQETVVAEETLRREELDVNSQGHPIVDDGK
jgi:uncharacterized protein (TIGR02271 family)